jgi:hypothetical protein
MIQADFFRELYIKVPIEMWTISWWEEDLVGTGKVFNRQRVKEEKAMVRQKD